ncbi:oligosaccharide flippase family protein [Vibrio parahaemolyticus]|uniref:oligosaccharide flippase family protein n=1 Tax=Vibrio parahaemolyticus TaxID=670 RepID=UPI0003F71D38|nr:polysaccharide biosynthesis C-terminal domain-containing protein [Vibrio parahaemolyticus]KIT35009.1 hypothetical protein H320_08315 [Vibrio parahaemolyticus 49]EGQ7866055.1 oligosaccharide flippase family protein [Vibrio parahaemolyticus]EGQ7886422.1 oligosaccharide flippase family protein [Vibrio parahaemolyticus]EGQ8731398.1 oligosaccharide flippase family protein [Vibrio parahaemolyticus]EGQ8914088.1 oligosaccharide flippase family protein [Vibrio parahaemolyticus]
MFNLNETSRNTVYFTISTFGSKAISFALLPLYSYKLSVGEFGELDLLLTMSMLLMPMMTLSLFEAVQKYLLSKEAGHSEIMSTAIIPFLGVCVVFFFLFFLVDIYFPNINYVYYLLLLLVSSSIFEFFSRYVKGIDRVFSFAIASLIFSFTLLIYNLLFLYLLDFNVKGVVLSYILAYSTSIIYLYISSGINKIIRLDCVNFSLFKRMLLLSSPLILNTMMWWVFDVSDRWLILYFLDKQAVGIYSMACKIAGLLLIIHTIIFQTWQVFAIKNYRSSNSKEGYDKFTKFYFLIIFISASFLMSISGLIFDYLFSSSYVDSWVVSNYLIIGSVFFSISSYFGVYYVVVGKTKRALSTSMLAAILNIFLNLVFIPKIGLKGAVIATVISNLFLMAVRAKDTKKLISTEHGYYLLTTLILCLLVQLYLSTAFPIYISLIIPFSLIFCLIMAWRSEGNSRI